MSLQSPLIAASLGGAFMGLGASLLWVAIGRVAGVSGIAAGLLDRVTGGPPRDDDVAWRLAFLVGLGVAGACAATLDDARFAVQASRPSALYLLGGVLVGIGARVGSGCTSGHGVCGVARLSPRSLVATTVFTAVGALAAAFVAAVGRAS